MVLGKILAKPLDVQPAHAGLAAPDAAVEPDLAALGEEIHDLVVLRLVDEVAVRVLQAPDGVDVLLDAELVFEFSHAGF